MNLFGPLYWHELKRISRKQSPIRSRCFFTLLLLFLIGVTYLSLFPRGPQTLTEFLFLAQVDRTALANFGFIFFGVYAMTQFIIGTFAVASGASTILAEEKERQTLPFLLMTTLTDREIVFGKLAARVTQVLFILLAGLPVLALMQFTGGVDPMLLAAAFIATFATLIGTGSVAAAASVVTSNVKRAAGMTFGIVATYMMILPTISAEIQRSYYGTLPIVPGHLTTGDLLDWFNAGNPFTAFMKLARILAFSGRIDDVLPILLLKYVAFHSLVALIFGGWASLRLRKFIARQAGRGSGKAAKTAARGIIFGKARRPVAQERPVLWRETSTAVGKAGRKWYARWGRRLVFALSFWPIVSLYFEMQARAWGRADREIHAFVRIVGSIVLSASLLYIASTAAGMLGRERRQKTLDELLLTDLSNTEILCQKGLASVWAARWLMLWVAIHWVIDFWFGGMSPWALLFVPPLYALYVAVAVNLGLFFAVRETNQFKASPSAFMILLILCALPWAAPVAAYAVMSTDRLAEVLYPIAAGLSPPSALGFLTIAPQDLVNLPNDRHLLVPLMGIGLVLGLGASLFLIRRMWRGAIGRMRQDRRE